MFASLFREYIKEKASLCGFAVYSPTLYEFLCSIFCMFLLDECNLLHFSKKGFFHLFFFNYS